MEVGGDHVGGGDAVTLDEPECLLRVPAIHQHHGVAVVQREPRVGERGGVVHGRGAEVHVLAPDRILLGAGRRDVKHAEVPGHAGRRLVRIGLLHGAAHPLGPAGSARGVLEELARDAVGGGGWWVGPA